MPNEEIDPRQMEFDFGNEPIQSTIPEHLSIRGQEWLDFALLVLDHIEDYTVPQYGDKGADRAKSYTLETIAEHIGRYKDRIGSNARGDTEAKRDMIKIAHYASFGYNIINSKPS